MRRALFACALAACAEAPPERSAPILLYAGAGTSVNDVAAVEALLRADSLRYATVSTKQLNALSEADLAQHRLLIVPGGNFIEMGDGWTPGTVANVRGAVTHGLNYLGLCAGAFLAGSGSYRSLNLTDGVRFGFYAAAKRGIRKAAVAIMMADSTSLEHFWEDGPELTGWGDVVGRYPDGTPAIVEGHAGKGWVMLTGIHPEAPDSWRRGMTFRTTASADNAVARTIVAAALGGKSLPHF
jgi:glutamine amidotransferase-like uncharacterized protein